MATFYLTPDLIMTSKNFGTLPAGETVDQYTLTNSTGASLDVITYGGIITALRMPDAKGALADVVLGYDNLEAYVARHPYFGAIIGRIAGRLTGGRLSLEGRDHQLVCNDEPNHLHGGLMGLDKRVWTAQPVTRADRADSLRLTYHSPDGEEGYPGNVDIAITYTLTAQNELIIESEATSDRATPLSLTNHSYFNLGGEDSGSVADHQIQILAEACVPPTDEKMTLSGKRQLVAGTPSDLREPQIMGDVIAKIYLTHGDNYHLRSGSVDEPSLAARVVEPISGRVMEVSTNDTNLQFYTGTALDGTDIGKAGKPYEAHAGLCLECQGYPDGVSHPELGDILVRPGTPQRRTTIYAFSTV